MRDIIIRFSHPMRGIIFALHNDRSYRNQVYVFGAIVAGIFVYFDPLSYSEMLFVLLAYALILITELQNSALEAALDRIHPERHNDIGNSKDMAAGAVLTAGVFLLIVIGVLVISRI